MARHLQAAKHRRKLKPSLDDANLAGHWGSQMATRTSCVVKKSRVV